MFDALSARFAKTFGGLRAKGKISSSDIESVIEEIRGALLEADVALEVVNLFSDRIHTQVIALLPTLQAGSNQAQAIFDVVNVELTAILGSEARRIRIAGRADSLDLRRRSIALLRHWPIGDAAARAPIGVARGHEWRAGPRRPPP